MKHFNITFKPDGKRISIHADATLTEAAGQAGIILNTVCGGRGLCGKCSVTIDPDGRQALACQHRIQTDLTVTIPPASRFFEQKILSQGIDRKAEIHPSVCKRYLNLKTDSIEPEILEAALNEISPDELYQISPSVVQQLKRLEHAGALNKGIAAVCLRVPAFDTPNSPQCRYTVASVEPGDTTDQMFGVAVDVGTTTVVAKLMNLLDGQCQATEAVLNPQSKYGDDVISRIAYAQNDAKLAKLHKVIVDCINELVAKLCKKASIDANRIYEMCVVGNTTMNHIFLKLPLAQLGQAPYKAFSLEAKDLPAEELALKINPAANIHTAGNIAGFVGSDATAVALAADMNTAEQMTLVVDIGTNGELLLGTAGKLYAGSCAAGPALEGARISQGSRAVEGAIEAVVVNNGDIDLDVIGGHAPHSICGSGLVDAMAVLLDLGIVEPTGRLVAPEKLPDSLSPNILSRVIEQNGQLAFVLARNHKTSEPEVVLTQKDIRELQLAKAAIHAGIRILQKKIGIEDPDIKHILIAGAFGNYIRRESALKIGLLPDVPIERIRFIGNAASCGAQMMLINHKWRTQARELARSVEYVEIAGEPGFAELYVNSMSF